MGRLKIEDGQKRPMTIQLSIETNIMFEKFLDKTEKDLGFKMSKDQAIRYMLKAELT